jgi:hypothetical protein
MQTDLIANEICSGNLTARLKEILPLIGNAPIKKLRFDPCNLFVRL